MVDPEHFYADPDPTFQADAHPAPDPNPFTNVRNVFKKFSCVIFSVRMREEG